ncbi:MAG: hypothetical protein ABJA94_10545 [Rhodoglobus sp.]
MPSTIDYSPLTAPVDTTAAAKLAADYASKGQTRPNYRPFGVYSDVLTIVLCIFVLLLCIPATLITLAQGLTGSRGQGWSAFGVYAFLATLAVAGLYWCGRRYLVPRTSPADWYRLHAFAAANNLQFAPWTTAQQYPSEIFTTGVDRATYDHVFSTAEPLFDIGNVYYQTGRKMEESDDHRWGYIAVNLGRNLPQMVLDSTANNRLGLSGLPLGFARDQVLKLEGDFNDHFTLYAPKEYERDATYVFTPDLMALLIDESASFDVEVIDDWMFVYSRTPFHMADPATLSRAFRIVELVGGKIRSQVAKYVDDRAPVVRGVVSAVAAGGRRLKASKTVLVVVLAAITLVTVFNIVRG